MSFCWSSRAERTSPTTPTISTGTLPLVTSKVLPIGFSLPKTEFAPDALIRITFGWSTMSSARLRTRFAFREERAAFVGQAHLLFRSIEQTNADLLF